jgi:methyl-accepting chemotaxis protein
MQWLGNWGLRTKILAILLAIGAICIATYSTRLYNAAVDDAVEKARADANNLLERSTQMFLVSTKKFHDDFQRTKDKPAERTRVLDDWVRTIIAVDDAVITDHGENKPRVKLTGDKTVYGYRPLGKVTTLDTPFEREAAKRLAAGEKFIEVIDATHLRVAAPLPAQAHPGCAECHFASVEGFGVDMSRQQLLGSLNAYVPLADRMAKARSAALGSIVTLTAVFGGMIAVVFWFMNWSVVRPIRRCMASVAALAKRDFSKKCEVRGSDELGRMAEAINDSIDTTKQAFEAVEDQVFFYESILNAIPHPLSVTDKDMRWTFINKAAEEVSGAKKADVLGQPCSGWGADICNTERCGVCMAKAQGGKARSSFTQPALPGAHFITDAAMLYDREGRHIGHIEVVQDVTATEQVRKYQAAEVDRLAKNLNQLAVGDVDLDTTVAEANEHTREFREQYVKINQALDTTVGAIRRLATDANRLAEAATAGNLNVRADATTHRGEYRRVIDGVNHMIAAVVEPLHAAGGALEAMAAKDFTCVINGQYPGEFGVLVGNVNKAVENVRAAMRDITENAAQFAEGSRVIVESSQTLAQGAQQQSSSVEEMTASIEELTRVIDSVKEGAAEADRVAREASRLAEDGGKAVTKSVESMSLIRTSSQQISEIIQVISEIASQTNLLALNAAIEAARAGEHGMGFAVVADEVRKLAERSNQAAREISSLIKESSQRVEEGAALSDQTGQSLKQIIAAVEGTARKIGDIAAATVQQASNAKEVSQAIQTVAQVTEQTAAGSEEMASSSEQLGAQAAGLRDLVARFKIDG